MLSLTRSEIGAALAGCVAIMGAAIAGYLIHEGVSRETPVAFDLVPPVAGAPLPRIMHEEHLTGWEGMSGGATGDAKVIRTTTATVAPIEGSVRPKSEGMILPQRPLQPPPVQGTPWPLGK